MPGILGASPAGHSAQQAAAFSNYGPPFALSCQLLECVANGRMLHRTDVGVSGCDPFVVAFAAFVCLGTLKLDLSQRPGDG